MTALAQPTRAVPSAVAPAHATDTLRRLLGTWSEPEPWTVAVLLVTGAVVMARHPLAQLIGTETTRPVSPAPVVATAAAVPVPAPAAAAAAGAAGAVRTHAPRDPFQVLVDAAGRVIAPRYADTTAAPAVTRRAGGAAVTCTGASYRVTSGDTLWAIAARSTGATAGSRVDVAWRRLYDANRAAIGPDPAMLPVGARLCLAFPG